MTASKFPIEAGFIMTFARAIGDYNPVYRDEDQARNSEVEGIIAPPTFVQASAHYDPDYPLRPQPGVPWFGSGATPTGRPPETQTGATRLAVGGEANGGTSLHAEQHYEYRRPIRPGEVLPSPRTPERRGKSKGAAAACSASRRPSSNTEVRTVSWS